MFHCKLVFLRYRQSNCRYVLTRYCSYHTKNVFVKKKVVLDVKKLDFSQNLTFDR